MENQRNKVEPPMNADEHRLRAPDRDKNRLDFRAGSQCAAKYAKDTKSAKDAATEQPICHPERYAGGTYPSKKRFFAKPISQTAHTPTGSSLASTRRDDNTHLYFLGDLGDYGSFSFLAFFASLAASEFPSCRRVVVLNYPPVIA